MQSLWLSQIAQEFCAKIVAMPEGIGLSASPERVSKKKLKIADFEVPSKLSVVPDTRFCLKHSRSLAIPFSPLTSKVLVPRGKIQPKKFSVNLYIDFPRHLSKK
jgi:hypothetical protein